MKYPTLILVSLIVFSSFSCRSAPDFDVIETPEPAAAEEEPAEEPEPVIELPPADSSLPVSAFREVWAYVVAGDEAALARNMPISDVGYFGAEIDSYGKLVDVPGRRKLRAFAGRVHLVVACNSRSLTHFMLLPGGAERRILIADLIAAAKDYDGLQIDFEYVPSRDGEFFLSFLEELRAGLGQKLFTIAVPARFKKIAGDVYDYEKIKPLVDRILIMAYDEHWSTSAPGPIASLSWCRRVAAYALGVIGKEKLIMGIPFYGRTWGTNLNRAYFHSGIERIRREQGSPEVRRENGIPTFDYEVPVPVKVYYEDDYSLSARMEMYRSLGVASVGFWRLGQETRAVWNVIRIE
jgi:spore germination protein YaaH